MKIARRKMRAEIPVVAMGDIAFTLVLFFVILAQAQDDSHLEWEPARTATIERVGHARVSVTVDVDSKLYVNGQQVGVRDLAGAVEALLGDAPAGQRTVLLKIHKETQAAMFEPVIEAVSQAGGELVHVLEEEQKTD
jgi:biopolymer transport protein ExbD